jgi:hypothetical protein
MSAPPILRAEIVQSILSSSGIGVDVANPYTAAAAWINHVAEIPCLLISGPQAIAWF